MTIDREELRRLCEAATPGPWKHYDDLQSTKRHEIVTFGKTVARIYCTAGQEASDAANARFIAAARTAVPALLDALEAAEAESARLQRAWDSAFNQAMENGQRAANAEAREKRLRDALMDIARGDYSDPMCKLTPEQRARDALAETAP